MSHNTLALEYPCVGGLVARVPLVTRLPQHGTEDGEIDDRAEDDPQYEVGSEVCGWWHSLPCDQEISHVDQGPQDGQNALVGRSAYSARRILDSTVIGKTHRNKWQPIYVVPTEISDITLQKSALPRNRHGKENHCQNSDENNKEAEENMGPPSRLTEVECADRSNGRGRHTGGIPRRGSSVFHLEWLMACLSRGTRPNMYL